MAFLQPIALLRECRRIAEAVSLMKTGEWLVHLFDLH